eukprot:Selendium_serpulae@DN4757_c0_g1_i1.p1
MHSFEDNDSLAAFKGLLDLAAAKTATAPEPASVTRRVGDDVFKKRGGHAVATLGDKVFIFGGLKSYLNDLMLYDPDTCKYSELCADGKVPCPRAGHTLIPLGDTLVLHGGYTEEKDLADTWIYHVATNKWEELECVDTPQEGRFGHTAIIHEGSMYVYGGFHLKCIGNLCRLELRSSRWHYFDFSNSIEPKARDGHRAALHNGRMYIFSGYDGYSNLDDLWFYDLSTGVWERVESTTNCPGGRYSYAAVQAGDKWVIHGGYSCGMFHWEMYEFRFDTAEWKRVPVSAESLPRVCYHAACLKPGGETILLFGGLSCEGTPVCATSNTLYEVSYKLPKDGSQINTTQSEMLLHVTEAYLDLQKKYQKLNTENASLSRKNNELQTLSTGLESDVKFIMNTVSSEQNDATAE